MPLQNNNNTFINTLSCGFEDFYKCYLGFWNVKKLFKKPTLLDMKGEMNKISIKIMSVIRLFRNVRISFIKSGADILLLQFLSLKCPWQSAQSPVNKQTNKKGAWPVKQQDAWLSPLSYTPLRLYVLTRSKARPLRSTALQKWCFWWGEKCHESWDTIEKLFNVVLAALFCCLGSPLYLLPAHSILSRDCSPLDLFYVALIDTEQAGFIVTDRSYKNTDANSLTFSSFNFCSIILLLLPSGSLCGGYYHLFQHPSLPLV